MDVELQERSSTQGEASRRRSGLGRYLTAAVLVRLADEGARVALVLLALDRTRSAAVGGALVAALLVPHVVAAPLVGLVVDRVRQPRRVLSLAALGLGGALAFSAWGLGRVPVAAVAAVLLVGGCCGPALTGALTSQLASLLEQDRLPRAFGLDSMTYNLSGIVGPALAAVVAGSASPGWALVGLSAAAALGGTVLATVPPPPRVGRQRLQPPPLSAGLSALFRDRVLGVTTGVSSLGQLGPGGLPVVAAVIAARQHQPAISGWLLTCVAVGGLVGSLLWTWRPAAPSRAPRVVLFSMVGTGGCLAASAAAGSLVLTALLFLASGVFVGPFTGALFTVRQELAPEPLRAQVFALGAGMKTTAAAAGSAIAGAVGSWVAPAQLLVVGGFPLLAATLGAVLLAGRAAGTRP